MQYKNRICLILIVFSVTVVIHAADLIKFNTQLARGSATLSDAGSLSLTSRRCFQNVHQFRFPGNYRGIFMAYTNTGIAHLDGFIFLTGTLRQNQTSFPGSYQYKNASGQTVASISDNGDLYIKGSLLTSNTCMMPPYEPLLWNDGEDIQDYDNCYNYGNNQITFTYAQPGRAAGYREWVGNSDFTIAYIRERALADGLTWVGWNYPGTGYNCPGGGHLVFLAIDPGVDYHWWRKDSGTSYWSHKPGWGEATFLDASDVPITNPLQSNRNFPGIANYSDNAGFYCTCGNNANVR